MAYIDHDHNIKKKYYLVQTRTTLNLFIVYLFIYFGKLFSLTDPHFISKRKIINYVYEVNPLYPFFLRSYQHVMS